ncbi:hypothetical protein [Paractinoplanes maris]|uniref:hypothetical protein n=1 Tax=Paractinoplanes maris TaxID=1734446 RepID=UPI0020204F29|nr:hypothetical protein [Actinoplanes maris]
MTTSKHAVTRTLASLCGVGSCPTVYGTDNDTVVVQGYETTGEKAGVEVPDGERLVEIPVEVLLAAADKIRSQA